MIVPLSRQPPPDPDSVPSSRWPNFRTKTTALSITGIFATQGLPWVAKMVINAPPRLLRVETAFLQRDYVQLTLDVTAYAALCIPRYGWLFAIGIDLASECLNAYFHRGSLQPRNAPRFTRIDPTVPENALRILNVSAEEAERPETVAQHRNTIIANLAQRQTQVLSSTEAAAQFQLMIDDVHTAYRTLSESGL